MTFLPCMRLMRCRRSFARWQASLDCPKGTSRAGAPSIFSSAEATCTEMLSSTKLLHTSMDSETSPAWLDLPTFMVMSQAFV